MSVSNAKLEKFLKLAREIHGDDYKYDKVTIENSLRIKVEIWCNCCQEYFWKIARGSNNKMWIQIRNLDF